MKMPTIKTKEWPNGLGVTVRAGNVKLEVWYHGGVTRIVDDNSLCGYHGTHYSNVPVTTFKQMAEDAVYDWKRNGKQWNECY